MPALWFALKRSLGCRSEPLDVFNPEAARKSGRIVCGDIKDVVIGKGRKLEKPPSCGPKPIRSSELLKPTSHEVLLSTSNKNKSFSREGSRVYGRIPSNCGAFHLKSSFTLSCHKCGELFRNWEAIEAHHFSRHAVTELFQGDFSRRTVEIICQTSQLYPKNSISRIGKVLKVNNMQNMISRFEEYREMVKIKASRLPTNNPRCLADGNELLRFYGTTVICRLALKNSSSTLCLSEYCGVCRALRTGFASKKELSNGEGIFTNSSGERALESIELYGENPLRRKALILCRVIAGRIHKPLETFQGMGTHLGFDSVAEKVGTHFDVEELYLLNPKALLPCFVVIFNN